MIELIGFEKEYSDLLKRYKSNNLPNSILIHGLSGIGKRTFLNKLVKNIINIEFKDSNLDHHLNLFKNNTHPNIKIIEKEIDSKTGKIKSNITIEQIRRLKTFLNSTTTIQNSSKIVIVDSADYLNISSANSMLKILEEPKENTYIFLISNQISLLLPTIRSRCLKIKFNTHNLTNFTYIIKDNIDEISNEEINFYFKLTYGSPGTTILFYNNDFLDIFQLSIKCLLSNDLDDDKINLSNILSKLTNDEFNNYLSMLKFILIVANKLKVKRDDKSLINMPNYLELESLSTNLTKKNLIDRFDYLTNNQKELFSLNLDKKIFILNFLTQ
ncbi:AAA family ATPase [Pelagibacteraceae bacterium]|nr:AAA family ATPase [Pelagibacteraceae bacterium]